MARLRIVSGDGVEQMVEVREQRLQIGRGRDSDVVLPDPEKGVSRTHAELRLENDRYVIVDLQSQNGTYLNGTRVERAEVPYGAEIAVGGYRLMLLRDSEAAGRAAVRLPARDPLDDMRPTGPHEPPPSARLSPAPPDARPVVAVPASAAPASAGPAPWAMGLAVAVLVMVALAATVWVAGSRRPASPTSSDGEPVAAAPLPKALDATPAAGRAPDPTPPPVDRPNPPDDAIDRAAGTPPPKTTPAGTGPAASRVGRRPGESVEAWRSRGAALQMRYEYSTAALDRGDFAAAAGGFEAILMEEPGFLDAPALLVQAQSGLRSSARRLYEAGQKLESAGDWTGALQKYEQARQIFAGIDGLSARLQQVRSKLREAGTTAFNEGRAHEAGGRTQEALKAYERAIQWLPADDPNRHAARARVEQIKRTIGEHESGQQ